MGGSTAAALATRQIIQVSLYWLGITAIWGGLNGIVLQRRLEDLVGRRETGMALALLTTAGAIVAILVQPTVGAISDYTLTRWGRRKPYIAIGASLDLLFLVGIALSQTFVSILAFVMLLQFSSNFAQGPFQGYVPDLVPARQVGFASALVGFMTIAGRIAGVVVASVGLLSGSFVVPVILLGLVELATALATLRWVDEGRPAPPRAGRSWLRIALSAWGTDLLRERSFLWLLASRLFILMGGATLIDLAFFYLSRSQHLERGQLVVWINVATAAIAVTTGITTIPAARLSDRVGRKRVISLACLIGALGMLGMVVAPTPQVSVLFAVVTAVGIGAFISVDWALMTDVIPKAASGRYMGISNVVTAGAGPLALAFAGVTMDRVGRVDLSLGPRAAYAIAILFFVLGAILLRPVDERRRDG